MPTRKRVVPLMIHVFGATKIYALNELLMNYRNNNYLQVVDIKHTWGERAFSHVGPQLWHK